jgi:hypothetical protein
MDKCGPRNAFPGPGCVALSPQTRRLELDWQRLRRASVLINNTVHSCVLLDSLGAITDILYLDDPS